MIEEIHKSFAEVYDKGYVNGYKDAKKKFDRQHGEWEYKPMKGAFCSVCGWHSIWKFNFCPNCGADMREGEQNENCD
jgi:hypothetical protein